MNRLALLWAFGVTLATGLGAQQVLPAAAPSHSSGSPWPIHYGKWAAAALTITFTVLGAQEHEKSNSAYSDLLDLCRASDANCTLAPDGTYRDPGAEQLYQSSLSYDRRARVRLFAGQASLLLCASLFVADLRHHGDTPDNIPMHGMRVAIDPLRGKLGMRVTF